MAEDQPVVNFNEQIIREFREKAGRLGGSLAGRPMVLLHTTGARSGAERVNPLASLSFEGRLFVFGSKAGAPVHPDWYYNLVKNPSVTVETGEETFPATAVVLEGEERDRVFAMQVERMPVFTEYAEKAGDRLIPVIELKR